MTVGATGFSPDTYELAMMPLMSSSVGKAQSNWLDPVPRRQVTKTIATTTRCIFAGNHSDNCTDDQNAHTYACTPPRYLMVIAHAQLTSRLMHPPGPPGQPGSHTYVRACSMTSATRTRARAWVSDYNSCTVLC